MGDGKPLPPKGVIQVAFDRYLLPVTVTRQAVQILDATGKPLPVEKAPFVVYDPVARTVTLTRPANGAWLTPGQPYKLHFPIAPGNDDTQGLRAIDRATLEPSQKLDYSFFVADDPANQEAQAQAGVIPGEPPNVSFCKDVLPFFLEKCSGPTCHSSGERAAQSLILDTGTAVAHTAKNRVAQESNTGGIAARPEAEGRLFGVDMPILGVDEGASATTGTPANSWLMYKLELAPSPTAPASAKPTVTCSGGVEPGMAPNDRYVPVIPGVDRDPDDIERAILSDFILGRSMPYPLDPPRTYFDQPLTFQEREIVRMWIQRGAKVEDCGACTVQ